MTSFYKLALIAVAALAMVSGAPIDPNASTTTTAATTTATTTSATASAPSSTSSAEAPAATNSVDRQTSASMISDEQQTLLSAQGLSSPYSGRGTWFTDTVGSCGTPFDTNDLIVAMNAHQMGGTSQCGKKVRITAGGKTVTARVTDTCPAQYCAPGSLDLSQAVFKQLAPLDQGIVNIQWEFV